MGLSSSEKMGVFFLREGECVMEDSRENDGKGRRGYEVMQKVINVYPRHSYFHE
jgi:sulfur relay (sulfurtransferase) DsrF/TusC family protein